MDKAGRLGEWLREWNLPAGSIAGVGGWAKLGNAGQVR